MRITTTTPYAAVLAVIALAACTTVAPPSPPPSASPSPAASAERSPAAPPSPSAPPSSTPAPTPGPTAEPAIGLWQPIPEQDSIADLSVDQVAWTGTRFVALGFGGAVVTSTDGLTWRAGKALGTDVWPMALATGPSGVVAIGSIDDDLASWWSPDGLEWTAPRRAVPGRPGRGHAILVTDVVATGDGWVAVGREDPGCMTSCPSDPVRALVWRSADGLHWKRVPDQEPLRGGGMNAVGVGGPGLVAAGDRKGRATVWTSVDGSTWSRVPDDPAFHPRPGPYAKDQQTMGVGVASSQGVLVVVGIDTGAQDIGFGNGARAWWSADGRTWTEASIERPADAQLVEVATGPSGFLAVGAPGEPRCSGGIWTSSDGRAWSCSGSNGMEDGWAETAAASSTVEIALGLAESGDEVDEEYRTWGAGWWRSVP